jgi:hypothetical protein
MRYLLVILCLCVACLGLAKVSLLASAPQTVAIIPVLNSSGETWEEGKKLQTSRAEEEIRALFTERGFNLVDSAAVRKAIDDLKVDFSDEEQQKRDVLYKVGDAVSADLVVFVVITDVDQRKVAKFLVTSTEGKAKMKAWLLGVKDRKAFMSAKVFEGSSKSGGLIEIGEKGSSRKQLAVANGIRRVFVDDYLKDFPITQKVERSKVGR